MATGTVTTPPTSTPAAATLESSTLKWYIGTFAVLNVLAIVVVSILIGVLGYHWNVGRLIALLVIVDLLAVPAFLLVKHAESGRDHWGGFWETWAILAFGAIALLLGLALIPPEAKRWVEGIFSPYQEAQLLPRPRTKSTPPPTNQSAVTTPEGTERIFVTLPKEEDGGPDQNDVKEVIVHVRVTPDAATTTGILVDKNNKGLRVYYRTKDQMSFTDDN